MNDFIAHRRKDGLEQPLLDHLTEVGSIAAKLATKFNVSDVGELIGLLHDFGKFGHQFQKYIGSATGKINPDEDDFIDFKGMKGKIDHSSAGAQWIWDYCKQNHGKAGQLVGQILSLCIASHHSGLIDCLSSNGESTFLKRMKKDDSLTHQKECIESSPAVYIEKIEALLNNQLITSVAKELYQLSKLSGVDGSKQIGAFYQGLWTKMLFSCLIDADRINSADFETPENKQYRDVAIDWTIPMQRLESAIKVLNGEKDIDELRRDISDACKKRAEDKQGIYTLTVPTGGGKTYASLRYALHHAQKHQLDRIIYIIPFTSIIEQNAEAIREVIECSQDDFPWVLEQHSNLEPEQQNWHSKLVSENWDAPIVLTTMVQFLEVLFSSGTRGVRKMHQLANSVLVFDEIQTLPINCTHLFCNTLNFLTEYCHTTAVLCTATQPLLDQLQSPEKGQLNIPKENELVSDVPKLFEDLQRTKVVSDFKPAGWSKEQISELAYKEFKTHGSCLIIVNTKAWAQQLYQSLQVDIEQDAIFHLSTNLCPAHRKAIFNQVRSRLDKGLPVLCISTQLIEAGVDIDFASVIRFLAGLDSIAQAAGRCNRNGLRQMATVYVVNPAQESVDLLTDIKVGKEMAKRVIEENFDDLLAPDAIKQYFKYYFFDRADEMTYLVNDRRSGLNDNLMNLLSDNTRNIGKNNNAHLLKQSFMTAAKAFKAIDSPTQAVIVPYDKAGKDLVAELCGVAIDFDVKKYRQLLKKAQRYSVNVFPNVWRQLLAEKAVNEIQHEGIYFLDEKYYSKEFGLCVKPCNVMSFADL